MRWDIVDDDGSAYTKWWGARIMRMVAPPLGQVGPVYVIAYDPEEGFSAEERTIRITALREWRRCCVLVVVFWGGGLAFL